MLYVALFRFIKGFNAILGLVDCNRVWGIYGYQFLKICCFPISKEKFDFVDQKHKSADSLNKAKNYEIPTYNYIFII